MFAVSCSEQTSCAGQRPTRAVTILFGDLTFGSRQAAGATRAMQAMLFGVSATDPLTYALGTSGTCGR
jgi:hypothetical protein